MLQVLMVLDLQLVVGQQVVQLMVQQVVQDPLREEWVDQLMLPVVWRALDQ